MVVGQLEFIKGKEYRREESRLVLEEVDMPLSVVLGCMIYHSAVKESLRLWSTQLTLRTIDLT